MGKICLFLFSGTGMTKYVVEEIKSELEKKQAYVDIYNIENTHIQSILFNNYDTIGIAYPVHAFNAPRIVIDYVKQFPQVDSVHTFIISTAGEDHFVNYASSDLLIRILNCKGYKVFYNRLFAMPSNFIVKYKLHKVEMLLNKANEEIPDTANELFHHILYLSKAFH